MQPPVITGRMDEPTEHVRSNDGSRFPHQTLPTREENDDYGITFPSYDIGGHLYDNDSSKADVYAVCSSGDGFVTFTHLCSTPNPLSVSEDDSVIKPKPTRHIDYLSGDWKEEDISPSWRHITANRRSYGQISRLENAAWRAWAKAKNHLRTVPPESLDWQKDSDITWLYGPLTQPISETVRHMPSRNNWSASRKPILKKRIMSEIMLQRSIFSSSLKQATAAVQTERSSALVPRTGPPYRRWPSYCVTPSVPSKRKSKGFTSQSLSGLYTPSNGKRKHIRFDNIVEQCVAVELKGADDDFVEDSWSDRDDDKSSNDGLAIRMKSKRLSRNRSETYLEAEKKTIQRLPNTTIKCRTDSPDVTEKPLVHSLESWRPIRLPPSPSQTSLKLRLPGCLPSVDGDDYDEEYLWEPSNPVPVQYSSWSSNQEPSQDFDDGQAKGRGLSELRQTPSEGFMPYEEDKDDILSIGYLGKVKHTVNMLKDLGYGIWNVT